MNAAKIENGMAVTSAGTWLAARGQPAACRSSVREGGVGGLFASDRAAYSRVETSGETWFADAARPFLTQLTCAAPITAVSSKVLVAPAAARTGAALVRLVPMSWKGAVRTTSFGREWVVFATRSRVARAVLGEDEILTVRADAAVAWTTKRPTGFLPRLRMRDLLLPRRATGLSMHFYGPGIVWFEGASCR